MTSEFEDENTVEVNATFLSGCEPTQCIKTTKRQTPIKNLFWWIECFPNGTDIKTRGSVCLYACTNFGGFTAKVTHSIDGSDIKSYSTKYYDARMKFGLQLATHELLRFSNIIRNDKIVVRCKICFEFKLDKLVTIQKISIFEDRYIVKFDRRILEKWNPDMECVDEEKRSVGGITWWIQFYPFGYLPENQGYVSVFFCIHAKKKVPAFLSCGMSINGTMIQEANNIIFKEFEGHGFPQCFSHQQCLQADHQNDIIDFVCEITFETQDQVDPIPRFNQTEPSGPKFKVSEKDVDTVVANYRRRHPTEAASVEKLYNYLKLLRMYSADQPNQRSTAFENKNYHFFHSFGTPPTVDDVKTKLGIEKSNKMFFEISAADLFTNFNKASQGRPVGAFTHCLYTLLSHRKISEINAIETDQYYVIVTGIDEYMSDDGFEEVYNLIHPKNLSQFYDEAMPNLCIDASAINFVFTCAKLPEWLIWRLAVDLEEKLLFEPELHWNMRESLKKGLKIIENQSWDIENVNCRDEVVDRIQSLIRSANYGTLSLKILKTLQSELHCWYPNWHVCGVERPPIWRFAVPCLIYKKAACGKTWYLVFYAPLEWSEELLNEASYECAEDNTEVEKSVRDYDNITNDNNFNAIEKGLNDVLGYPISMLLHQNAAGNDHCGILLKHREVYRSVNIRSNIAFLCKKLMRAAELFDEPFKSALFAVQQVIDRKVLPGNETLEHALPTVFTAIKRLLVGVNNDHFAKNYAVIYCNRSTVLKFGNRQCATITIGYIKVVVVICS